MSSFNINQYEITVSVDGESFDELENEEDVEQEDPNLVKSESTSITSFPSVVTIPLRPVCHPPKRKISKEGELFSRWLFYHLYHHRNLQPEKVALIEEVCEARCVTYGELVDGAIRTANYIHHHGIRNGDRVIVCMENCVEFVFYLLGIYLIGAVPVLLNPSHIASDKIDTIQCFAAVVDFENYGHMLRVSKTMIQRIEHVFVLAEEISSIYIAPHVWIYDGFGFLDFPNTFKMSMPMKDGDVTIFSTSGTGSMKPKFVAHASKSSQNLCHSYYDNLFDLLVEKDPEYTSINGHHLISNGLHCHDAWAYLHYVLVRGETVILAESTIDVWRASFLDRIAGLIEQYRIPLVVSNTQLLKCFVKYEVHKIFDLSSLKVIANHGSVVSSFLAKHIENMLNVTLTQAYSATEFGIISFATFEESQDEEIINCGRPLNDIQIKVAHLETEREVDSNEWGQIMISGANLFRGYENGDNSNLIKSWFRTGDYGKMDSKNRIYIGGSVDQLIDFHGRIISPEIVESAICQHDLVDDAVVMMNGKELWCGILLRETNDAPNTDQLDKLLKKQKVKANISKIVILDFIPRSENGKLLRSEVPYQMNVEEEDDSVLVENSESYI